MGLICQLFLSNPTKAYYPGESLSGEIVITSDSETKIKGLKVLIKGHGHVKFIEQERNSIQQSPTRINSQTGASGIQSSSVHSEYVDVEYTAEETYLDIRMNIFGYSGSDCLIKRGKTAHPFSFKLPYELAPSYKDDFAWVDYSVTAVISMAWYIPNTECKVPIQVIGVVDLNNEPAAQIPTAVSASKTFGVFFQSGPLDITLRLSRSGAVPNEYVPFVAEIFNKSDKTVTESLQLNQKIQYFANGKTKTVERTVGEVLGQVNLPGSDHIWKGNVLLVPQVPTSKLGNCRIIDVKYELLLEMKVSGIGYNLKVKTPFVIGNVPIRGAPPLPPKEIPLVDDIVELD